MNMTSTTKNWLIVGVVASATALGGCSNNNPSESAESDPPVKTVDENLPTRVYTTMYPTTFVTQAIVGDLLEVICPVPEDADPLHWSPTIEQIQEMQNAGRVFLVGADVERWIETSNLPVSRVVDTSASFADDYITISGIKHSHGGSDEHSHEGIDGHVWLDPVNLASQALTIRDALTAGYPKLADQFNENYVDLDKRLTELNNRFNAIADNIRELQLLCSHPAYNYLARRYDWDVVNFDLDPEEPLSDEQIEMIRAKVDTSKKSIMLWESAPLPETAERLERELGVISTTFSPIESAPRRQGNYISVMNNNIAALIAAARRRPVMGQTSGGPDSR